MGDDLALIVFISSFPLIQTANDLGEKMVLKDKRYKHIKILIPPGLSVLMLLLILTVSVGFAATEYYQGKPAKYVFLFIGDGMGMAQRTAAEKYAGARLAMNRMPAMGMTGTSAANRSITDSAAAATALSSGRKTDIGILGIAPDNRAVKTIAEIARDRGQKVGIVSSVSLDHATPAAFYAHVRGRNQFYDIALALAQSGFDFFGGGGLLDPTNKRRTAVFFKGDANAEIRKAGYRIVDNKEAFSGLKPGSTKIFSRNFRLTNKQALPYTLDMGPEDINLFQFTAKAIKLLDNPKGFFLMVEGGKIDWACHANDGASAIHDILSLDKAVQEAVDFARKHTRETLVVVTADHETGGLSLGSSGKKGAAQIDLLKNQKTSYQRFSDELFLQYRGKCGDSCSFDSVKPLITRYFGLKFKGNIAEDPLVLTDDEISQLETAFKRSLRRNESIAQHASAFRYGGDHPLATALIRCLNSKAGLDWASSNHTGVAVATSALGVGADTFEGAYENTDLAKKIMAVMGIKPKVHE